MDYNKLLDIIEAYAADILKCQPICQFQYHNIDHTRSVVKNVEVLGKSLKVDKETMLVLKIAAWFHDLGYVNSYTNHEDESIRMASEFLSEAKLDQNLIDRIVNGIDATRVPQKTDTIIGKIMADADLFDLGTDRFFVQSKNLRKEWNKHLKPITKQEFWIISRDFVESHHYFTAYAKENLEPKKQENLQLLKKDLRLMG